MDSVYRGLVDRYGFAEEEMTLISQGWREWWWGGFVAHAWWSILQRQPQYRAMMLSSWEYHLQDARSL
jgi:hypothetical protein